VTLDRRSFDTGTSAQVQGDLQTVISRLEAVIADRNKAVQSAMSDFQADGVSDQYASVEQRWHSAAGEVQAIIGLVRTTMIRNDDTASSTSGKARNAVASIG